MRFHKILFVDEIFFWIENNKELKHFCICETEFLVFKKTRCEPHYFKFFYFCLTSICRSKMFWTGVNIFWKLFKAQNLFVKSHFFLLRYGRLIKVRYAGCTAAAAALARCQVTLPLWDALISMGSKQPGPKSLVDL